LLAVPPWILLLASLAPVDGPDLSSLAQLFSGATPLGADISRLCASRIGCVVQQGYGLTETSPAALVLPEDFVSVKPGSIGVPIANTECRIVDPETGEDLPAGVDGELGISGPQVMRGYVGRPDGPRAALGEAWDLG